MLKSTIGFIRVSFVAVQIGCPVRIGRYAESDVLCSRAGRRWLTGRGRQVGAESKRRERVRQEEGGDLGDLPGAQGDDIDAVSEVAAACGVQDVVAESQLPVRPGPDQPGTARLRHRPAA